MEMHELQQAWQRVDAQLQAQRVELAGLRHERGSARVLRRLRPLTLGLAGQVVVGLLLVFWAGGYWVDKLGQPLQVACGLAIHLYGIGLLVAAGLQLARLARIDIGGQPVVEVQRRLLGLRRLRIGCERALLVAGMVVWLPLVLIGLDAIGIDAARYPVNLALNLGVAALLAAGAAWLTRRYRTRFEADATGAALRKAEAELAELQASGD